MASTLDPAPHSTCVLESFLHLPASGDTRLSSSIKQKGFRVLKTTAGSSRLQWDGFLRAKPGSANFPANSILHCDSATRLLNSRSIGSGHPNRSIYAYIGIKGRSAEAVSRSLLQSWRGIGTKLANSSRNCSKIAIAFPNTRFRLKIEPRTDETCLSSYFPTNDYAKPALPTCDTSAKTGMEA